MSDDGPDGTQSIVSAGEETIPTSLTETLKTPVQETFSGAADPVATKTLINITATKGTIISGYIAAWITLSPSEDIPHLILDGVEMNIFSYEFMQRLKIGHPNANPLFVPGANIVTDDYVCVGLAAGLQFETSIKLEFQEVDGLTPNIRAQLIYFTRT